MTSMTADVEKVQLLRLHPCVEGLDDAAVGELAEIAELVRCNPGDVVFAPNEAVTSVYLVINGRLKLQLFDLNGKVVVQRFQGRGGQVGGLAAALAEPQPFVCTAEDPSLLMRMDYGAAHGVCPDARRFSSRTTPARWPIRCGRQSCAEKRPTVPRIAAFFHAGEATRAIDPATARPSCRTGRNAAGDVGQSAVSLGNHGLPARSKSGQSLAPEEIRRRAAEWLPRGRVVFDLGVNLKTGLAARAWKLANKSSGALPAEDWQRRRDAAGRSAEAGADVPRQSANRVAAFRRVDGADG